MHKLAVIVVASIVAVLFSTTATAHVKRWVGSGAAGSLNFGFLDCGDGSDPVLNMSIGGFCFGTKSDGFLPDDYPTASDCVPNSLGDCVIAIRDFSPLSFNRGVYCQDLNQDLFCGGAVGEPANARTEPIMEFCDAGFYPLIIDSPIDASPRPAGVWNSQSPATDPDATWAGHNWDPDHAIVFFMGTLDRGNPFSPLPCQGSTYIAAFGNGCHAPVTWFECG